MRTPVIRRVSGTDCAHNSGFYCTSTQGKAANLGLAAGLNEEDQEFYRPADGGPWLALPRTKHWKGCKNDNWGLK